MKKELKIDRDIFYKEYRKKFGRIKENQTVENMNVFLNSLETHANLFTYDVRNQQIAYVLASVHHESYDWKRGIYYGALKEGRAGWSQPRLRRLQDRYWLSGYYGRGPIQLTWKRNYEWAKKVTGIDLVGDPDLLLNRLDVGYKVTILGMTQGAYTGKSLDKYIDKYLVDYVGARRIVNGTDKAKKIARYARKFEAILAEALRAPTSKDNKKRPEDLPHRTIGWKLYSDALYYRDMHEVTHNTILRDLLGFDPAAIPWCAGFINALLAKRDLKGTGKLTARSFLKWGTKVIDPQVGDIVVFKRGASSWQGHVGIYAGHTPTHVKSLGGNQNNGVSIKEYPNRKVLGYRRIEL